MSAYKRSIALLVVLIALVLGAACGDMPGDPAENYACTDPVADDFSAHPRATEYETILDDIVSDNMPGAMMALRTADGQIWRGAGGQADLGSGVAMQTCNMSRAGSVAKPFVAVLVMQLVDEGVISLDDRLTDHLPNSLTNDIPNVGKATIYQVLGHTSGIPDYTAQVSYATDVFNEPTQTVSMRENLDYVRGVDADFAPGKDWNYSNTGYELLSYLVAEKTGKNFEAVLDERILAPLGLDDTYLRLDGSTPAGTVRGYMDMHGDAEVFDATDYRMGYTSAAGGLVTTTHDLTVFLEALFAGELVSQESLEKMKEPVEASRDKTIDGEMSAHGLYVYDTDHGRAWGHGGDVMGYHGEMMHWPESGATYVLLANGGFGQTLYTLKKEFRPSISGLVH